MPYVDTADGIFIEGGYTMDDLFKKEFHRSKNISIVDGENCYIQETVSGTTPQEENDISIDLQKKAIEIFNAYKDLSQQNKIDIIAKAFGCKTGEIYTSACTGKWRGTSDISIRFENGVSLFIGNHLTRRAKTTKAQIEYINRTLMRFNPEIIEVTKELALSALLQQETKDNEIALQKGLKPYLILTVEFNDAANTRFADYIGWYYVTLAVDGKICTHLETGLNCDIAEGRVGRAPMQRDYFVAGALNEVDYVFNNVGFSSSSGLYSLPLREEVRKRVEKILEERIMV